MTESIDELEPKSKSQKKRDMHALLELGEQLVTLSAEQLAKFNLDELLLAAIQDTQKITSHGAKRRQLQYLGKLMRSVDPQPIQVMLAQLHQQTRRETAHFHKLEQWRDKFIQQGDAAITDFLGQYPNVDRQYLRQLVRNAKQTLNNQQGPRAAKLLFRYLKQVLAEYR